MSVSLQEQYNKIYKYCYFKVNNAALAEDLTQETFLRFFNQNNYISRGKPLAYLYTIARNLCIDSYRKVSERPIDEDVAKEDVEINALEASLVMKQAMTTLPDTIQEILLLRFVNELSINEICKITRLSRFAIRRKINSGLQKLKTILKEDDFS